MQRGNLTCKTGIQILHMCQTLGLPLRDSSPELCWVGREVGSRYQSNQCCVR